MELPLALQGAQLGAAALTGAALGLIYDALRVLRRHSRAQAALDALFVLACALALVRLTLLPGRGEFRLYFFRRCWWARRCIFCCSAGLRCAR